MKPTPLTTSRNVRAELLSSAAAQRRQAPVTDYSYHSAAFSENSGRYMRNASRSFFNIADNYLKDEARHDFQSEAMLFVLITITAALPLINNLHALIQFVRAITSH